MSGATGAAGTAATVGAAAKGGGETAGAADLATPACPAETGGASDALRSPLRTRSVAGGSAALPAESAWRRAIAAARPLGMHVEVWLMIRGLLAAAQRDVARYTMNAVP